MAMWCAVVLFSAGSSFAQEDCEGWNERPLDSAVVQATQTQLALDTANNAYAASVVDDELTLTIITSIGTQDLPLNVGAGATGDPSLSTNSSGVTHLAFSQVGSDPLLGREILLGNNTGGSFLPPENLSNNRVDDYAPQLALDLAGEPHVVWAQRVGDVPRVMYRSSSMSEPVVVSPSGDCPAIFVDDDGEVHVAYVDGNDVKYTSSHTLSFPPGTPVTNTPSIGETSVSVGVTPDGVVLVSFDTISALYLSRMVGSGFLTPELIAIGGVVDSEMRVKLDGTVLLAYVNDGDVYVLRGDGTAFDAPLRVTETAAGESLPSVDSDSFGGLHVTFVRNDDEVIYASDACTPAASFETDVTSGRVPLEVQFSDTSTGAVDSWLWDFGDGQVSNVQNPLHVYNDPGAYTVSLTVSGPGGVTSFIEFEEFVVVQDPLFSMHLTDQLVQPGDSEVWFPVIATTNEPIQGFQTMMTYDSDFLQFVRSDFSLGAVAAARITPDLSVTVDQGTHVEIGVVFETREPFDGTRLPPGRDVSLVHAVFDIAEDAPAGQSTTLALVNDPKISRINNIFIVDGQKRVPALKSAEVMILGDGPPFLKRFLRGDFDGDLQLDIADPIATLNFLFVANAEDPPCRDSVDFDDGGQVDISDPIASLNFLFVGGPPPLPPYPSPGFDPSPDEFDVCVE